VVEAAGVEPFPAEIANWLMARDFSSQVVVNSLPCGQFVVLWSALESSGVLPSSGDILETVTGTFAFGSALAASSTSLNAVLRAATQPQRAFKRHSSLRGHWQHAVSAGLRHARQR
jgi:hypothetical protein